MMQLPDWTDRTVVCIATGPSLTHEQVVAVADAQVRDHSVRVLAVNDAGLPAREPFCVSACDVWYAPDHRFWCHYRAQIASRRAIRVGAQIQSEQRGLVHATIPRPNGGHAGIQALRLALDLGAALVLLLGYDCRAQEVPQGAPRTNYFGRKPPELSYSSPEAYSAWVPRYRRLELPSGSRVVNCTPGSAIDAFPFGDLEQILKRQEIAA